MNDKVPVCLYGKDHLSDSGNQKRIENPGDKREQEKYYDCWFYLVPDYGWDGSCTHRSTASLLIGSEPYGWGVLLVLCSCFRYLCPLKVFGVFQIGKLRLKFRFTSELSALVEESFQLLHYKNMTSRRKEIGFEVKKYQHPEPAIIRDLWVRTSKIVGSSLPVKIYTTI